MLSETIVRALLIFLPVLGATGLYLALAGRDRSLRWMSYLLLAGAGATLLVLAAPLVAGGFTRGWFIVLAAIGVIGAVRMITHRKPVYSALYFILVVLSVTGLLVVLGAEFVAAALLIIYAGAILVTYVFVIMLAQRGGADPTEAHVREPFLGCMAGFIILILIAVRLFFAPEDSDAALPVAADTTVRDVGTVLLTNYIVALQATGLLLLAAMVGAVAVARRKVQKLEWPEEAD